MSTPSAIPRPWELFTLSSAGDRPSVTVPESILRSIRATSLVVSAEAIVSEFLNGPNRNQREMLWEYRAVREGSSRGTAG